MNNEIKKVLEGKNIDIKYIGMGTMSEYDKQKMRYYVLTINNNCFEYYEGLGLDTLTADNRENKILNAITCLVREYTCLDYCKDIYCFMSEFGYEDYKQAKTIYKQIKENSNKLNKIFTIEELAILEEETVDL